MWTVWLRIRRLTHRPRKTWLCRPNSLVLSVSWQRPMLPRYDCLIVFHCSVFFSSYLMETRRQWWWTVALFYSLSWYIIGWLLIIEDLIFCKPAPYSYEPCDLYMCHHKTPPLTKSTLFWAWDLKTICLSTQPICCRWQNVVLLSTFSTGWSSKLKHSSTRREVLRRLNWRAYLN